mmetsp:Transcript_31451/g.57113  ORF Transcript_31451/g.57113 Transcript_31451/m.57113 type:complete len:686 (+) Transcript_31451:14-2071(+)
MWVSTVLLDWCNVVAASISAFASACLLLNFTGISRRDLRRLFARQLWQISAADLLCSVFLVVNYGIMPAAPEAPLLSYAGDAVCNITKWLYHAGLATSVCVEAHLAIGFAATHFRNRSALSWLHATLALAWPLGMLYASIDVYHGYEWRPAREGIHYRCTAVEPATVSFTVLIATVSSICLVCYICTACRVQNAGSAVQKRVWRYVMGFPLIALLSFGPDLLLIAGVTKGFGEAVLRVLAPVLFSSNGFWNVLLYAIHSRYLQKVLARAARATESEGTESSSARSAQQPSSCPSSMRASFNVHFRLPAEEDIIDVPADQAEARQTAKAELELLLSDPPPRVCEGEWPREAAGLPERFSARVLGGRELFLASAMLRCGAPALLPHRVVADLVPRHGMRDTVESMQCQVQKGFRRKILLLFMLQLGFVAAVMALLECAFPRQLAFMTLEICALVATLLLLGLLVYLRHIVPLNYLCLLILSLSIALALASLDDYLARVTSSMRGENSASLNPVFRSMVIIAVSVGLLVILSQVSGSRGRRLLNLRIAAFFSACAVVGISLVIHLWIYVQAKVVLSLHAVAFVLVLWIGHDAQQLVQRLNADEYMMAPVHFYADIAIGAFVLILVCALLPVGWTDCSCSAFPISCCEEGCGSCLKCWVPVDFELRADSSRASGSEQGATAAARGAEVQ